MAIKFNNEITSIFNNDNCDNMPIKSIDNIYGNTFKFNNSLSKANIFLIKDKRNYLKFRKFLINEGFIMMQESVYSKLVLNNNQSELLLSRLRKNAPKKGLIQVLTITEQQYSKIEYIIGESNSKIINNEDRLIVL